VSSSASIDESDLQNSSRRPAGGLYLSDISFCRTDLPGPTTSVGTRTDYSAGH
jgi:hypothetical protein